MMTMMPTVTNGDGNDMEATVVAAAATAADDDDDEIMRVTRMITTMMNIIANDDYNDDDAVAAAADNTINLPLYPLYSQLLLLPPLLLSLLSLVLHPSFLPLLVSQAPLPLVLLPQKQH